MERCIWEYRPAMIKAHHFAFASCDGQQKYLSKITGERSRVGCADIYEWKICPSCGKPIQMDYSALSIEEIKL